MIIDKLGFMSSGEKWLKLKGQRSGNVKMFFLVLDGTKLFFIKAYSLAFEFRVVFSHMLEI